MKKTILTLSGKSGAGKTTLSDALVETGKFEETVSFTTRTPRPGEINGKHYNFISKEEFHNRLNNQEILEYTNINGNFYGTDLSEINRIQSLNKTPVIVCDPECPKALKENKDIDMRVVPVFVDASSNLLSERIIDRIKEEYSIIKDLREQDPEEAKKYETSVHTNYEKRIQGMSDLSVDEISDIFKDIDEGGEYKKDILSKGMDSPHSKEAKWRNMVKYEIIVDAEDINNNLQKGVHKVEKHVNSSKKKKNELSFTK
jgi:guanylate kinase